MAALRKTLLVEKVYQEIKQKILNGNYLPGMHLVEADLVTTFKVSRATLRDALRRLFADGLVDIIPNSGIRVRKLSYKNVIDLYMVREVNEALAARLAAETPSGDITDLVKISSEMAAAVQKKDRLKFRYWNHLFHHTMALLSENQILVETLEKLNTQILELQFLSILKDADLEKSQREHEEIVEAILSGNGDKAEKIIRKHTKEGRDLALSFFPEHS